MVSRTLVSYTLAGMVGLVIGAASMHAFEQSRAAADTSVSDLVDHGGSRHLTNPLLACGDLNELTVGAMSDLHDKLQDIVDTATKSGSVTTAALYVRDLDDGPWTGVNENTFFYPASLLKVPLMFSAYKNEEAHPGFLSSSVTFPKPLLNSTYLFPPTEELEPGKAYTKQELLRRTIEYSDNEAAALLGNAVGFGNLVSIFGDFGIKQPASGQDYQMKVRTYASFFRVLYNASYLSHQHSEEALELLTHSDFKDGIVAGVPAGITVAHKFGEREGTVAGGDIQLHDCGIVYSPGKPYLLCIMSQGKTSGGILELMRRISQATYAAMRAS